MENLKSPFVCPVCKKRLFNNDRKLICDNGHSFDLAKQGYVNLLMKNASGKHHGDDKLMVRARRDFLNKGYYGKLKDKIISVLGSGHVVLDAGCGEGYYTSGFSLDNKVIGIDISKDAVKYAAGLCKNADFAVASISDIPVENGYADTVINIFAPDSNEEYLRILSNGGRLITVVPMKNHLKQLKEAVYDNPYLNPPVNIARNGFSLISSEELRYKISLSSNEDILSLFRMTPYYYKTGEKDQAKLEKYDKLTTDLEFLILVYEKTYKD